MDRWTLLSNPNAFNVAAAVVVGGLRVCRSWLMNGVVTRRPHFPSAAAAKIPLEKAECQLRMADTQMRRQQWAKAEEILKAVQNDNKVDREIAKRVSLALETLKLLQQANAQPEPP